MDVTEASSRLDPQNADVTRGRSFPWLVVLAASAGGVEAIRTILAGMTRDFPAAVVVVLHRPADRESHLHEILSAGSPLPVIVAHDRDAIAAGIVYVADRMLI